MKDERGLRAVARVRGVRERDSKLGLQQAARAVDERVRDLETRIRALDAAPRFAAGSAGDLVVSRAALAAMAREASAASDRVEAGRAIAVEALGRWQHDRSRLRAVELLADRRAARRREERRKADQRDLDDIAGRMWLRARADQP